MQYLGETISLVVAFSWTITALFAEVASKRIGSPFPSCDAVSGCIVLPR